MELVGSPGIIKTGVDTLSTAPCIEVPPVLISSDDIFGDAPSRLICDRAGGGGLSSSWLPGSGRSRNVVVQAQRGS